MSKECPGVAELAAEANRWLVRGTRTNGEEFVHVQEGAPEWITQLCQVAHAAMPPDDWRYELIEDSLTCLEEDGDGEIDLASRYPCTADRLDWLASRLERMDYCDIAIKELKGMGGQVSSIGDAIALGMEVEIEEVLALVRYYLESREEELRDADADE